MVPLLLASLLATSSLHVPRTSVAAPATLDDVRASLGVATGLTGEISVSGRALYRATECGYSFKFGPGGFEQEFRGRLGEKFGFDGSRFWQQDCSEAPRRLWFEDVDRLSAVCELLDDSWCQDTVQSRVASGPEPNEVTVTMQASGVMEEVKVDPGTFLPVGADISLPDGPMKIKLSDWRIAGTRKLPFHAEISQAGQTDQIQAESAQTGDETPADYALPTWTDEHSAYDPTVPAALPCKLAQSGHLLVHPLINGQDVGWFILDSCADSMCIDPQAADVLHLPKMGEEPCVGVGGVVMAPFRIAESVKIGPATLKDIPFVQLDLGGTLGDLRLAGIVGYELFKRFVVAVDSKTPGVSVLDRATYQLPTGASWAEARFCTANPAVVASFDRGSGWFNIDTGSDGSVLFHSPAVRKLHLLTGQESQGVQFGGVGGQSEAYTGSVDWFQLGTHRFDHPQVTFSTSKSGALSNFYLMGNIGQEILSAYTTVFDFANYRIAFIPHE